MPAHQRRWSSRQGYFLACRADPCSERLRFPCEARRRPPRDSQVMYGRTTDMPSIFTAEIVEDQGIRPTDPRFGVY